MKRQTTKQLLLQVILGTAALIYRLFYCPYFWLSRRVLKRYLNIETPLYRSWHDRRAKHLQTLLDEEHSIYPSF